jgi:DNA-binding NarL/FixJ family response regulator
MRLTPRERQLIQAILDGAANREIARLFGTSEQTVKNQLVALYEKTGATSRLELAMLVVKGRLDVDGDAKT